MSPAALETDGFARLAADRLRREPPGPFDPKANPRGDHDLEPMLLEYALATAPRGAAVLVPVVPREHEVTVLFTQRAANLRNHSGQVAFPGGKIDEGEGPLAAALREAEEEIGLARDHVRPLGYLDGYLSGTGFFVTPVVAFVDPPFELALNEDEVSEVFEVPLSFLMDPSRHELHTREWRGIQRTYYAVPFGDRYIWGVTAGIIKNLFDKLYGP